MFKNEMDKIVPVIVTEELCDKANTILKRRSNELTAPFKLDCIEPDFSFHLYPKQDLRPNPSTIYV